MSLHVAVELAYQAMHLLISNSRSSLREMTLFSHSLWQIYVDKSELEFSTVRLGVDEETRLQVGSLLELLIMHPQAGSGLDLGTSPGN